MVGGTDWSIAWICIFIDWCRRATDSGGIMERIRRDMMEHTEHWYMDEENIRYRPSIRFPQAKSE